MEMADRVAVMERGRIVQLDAPHVLLAAPATEFVAGFLGEATRLPLRIEGGVARLFDDALPVALPDGEGTLFLRPHEVRVEPGGPGVVRFVRPEGAGGLRVLAEIDGRTIEGIATDNLGRGDACGLRILSGTLFHQDGQRQFWTARAAAAVETA